MYMGRGRARTHEKSYSKRGKVMKCHLGADISFVDIIRWKLTIVDGDST
jgi:hypothetical protein